MHFSLLGSGIIDISFNISKNKENDTVMHISEVNGICK